MEKNQAGYYEFDIDGKKYEFEEMDAEESVIGLGKLGEIIGEPLGMIAADKDVKPEMLGIAIKGLFAQLSNQSNLEFIKKLTAKYVLCDGKKVVFKSHYSGRDGLMHLSKVLKTALEVQYGNFFAELSALVPANLKEGLMTLVKQTSTGPSGGQSSPAAAP